MNARYVFLSRATRGSVSVRAPARTDSFTANGLSSGEWARGGNHLGCLGSATWISMAGSAGIGPGSVFHFYSTQTQCQKSGTKYIQRLVHDPWLSSQTDWRSRGKTGKKPKDFLGPARPSGTRLADAAESATAIFCRTTGRGFSRCAWRRTKPDRRGRPSLRKPPCRWHKTRPRRLR